MTGTQVHLDWFRRLDRIFWVMWALLPVMIYVAYRGTIDAGTPQAGMTPEQVHCFEVLPTPTNLSGTGKAIFWSYFAFQFSIYFVLFAVLHRIVHRFAKGRFLVSETLTNLQLMGIVLIVWPLLDNAVSNLVAYLWRQTGDMPVWTFNFSFDLAPIAVGVFLIALKGVLEHAMALKAEHDLTI